MMNCDGCAMAKLCQKNMPKLATMKSKTPGERLFINISHPQSHSFGGLQYWLLIVDDATDYCFSIFLKSKDQLGSAMIRLIKELKSKYNIIVHKIQCDNSSENVTFKNKAKEEGLGLNFKFTACQMPQQNGCVERKYATLFGQVHAMLNSTRLSGNYKSLCHGLWAECANTATKLANIAAPSNKSPPHFQFFNTTPLFMSNLHVFWWNRHCE